MTLSGSSSGSGTHIIAALFPYFGRCLSTQLNDTLSFPPTNHFQKGGLLVSRVLSQRLSQVRKLAYSSKHPGKLLSPNLSYTALSEALACSTNLADGLISGSSFQYTPIFDSETSLDPAMFHRPSLDG